MADCAIGREAGRNVSRVGGSSKVGLVAPIARSGERCVVVIRVASCARHRGVEPGQRECRGVVIEGGARPIGGGMARGARGGEAHLDVIGVRGSVVIGFVAGVAIRCQCCVVIVGVASCAGHRGVETGQWEHCRVIERRRCPVTGRVAKRAIRRETR